MSGIPTKMYICYLKEMNKLFPPLAESKANVLKQLINISLQVVTVWFKCPASTTLDISIARLETKQTRIFQLYKKDYNEFI